MSRQEHIRQALEEIRRVEACEHDCQTVVTSLGYLGKTCKRCGVTFYEVPNKKQ